jgi:hypothetical protein
VPPLYYSDDDEEGDIESLGPKPSGSGNLCRVTAARTLVQPAVRAL